MVECWHEHCNGRGLQVSKVRALLVAPGEAAGHQAKGMPVLQVAYLGQGSCCNAAPHSRPLSGGTSR